MNLRYVSIDEVYFIHKAIFARAGSKGGVRDFGLLHSAVERPKATFFGKDLYPTLFDKAAALLQSLTLNHPFTDGNKRVSWITTKRFLKLNGCQLRVERDDAVEFMISVGNEKLELTKIAEWLKQHSERELER